MPIDLILAQAQGGAEKFVNATLSGLALGAIYALLALGLVMIYKSTQVLNFAHGALAALGAYFAAYFAVTLNFPGRYISGAPQTLQWILSGVTAILLVAALGFVIERLTIRPMIGEPLFAVVMITIALDIILRTFLRDLVGDDQLPEVFVPGTHEGKNRNGTKCRSCHRQHDVPEDAPFACTVDAGRCQHLVGHLLHELPYEKYSERKAQVGRDQSSVRIHPVQFRDQQEQWNQRHLLGQHHRADHQPKQQCPAGKPHLA